MADLVIHVDGLSKQYRLGQQEAYRTLRDSLSRGAYRAYRRLASLGRPSAPNGHPPGGQRQTIWALKDVSFDVRMGDVVGIIGRNGAGKSTLLKILSRITEPSAGYAQVRGRVGSLLEVGSGFNPELTGRENVYLNGSILGMKRTEIARKFDEIVAFAEVEDFIDTPVKRYSSGMYMRLAFAVAAHLEPEILLVDEVLAVGDVAFQKKCLGKIGNVAEQGRTVLFVSHNLIAVQSLCNRAIWLQQGQVKTEGQPGAVISNYLQTSFSRLTEQAWDDPATAPGNAQIRLHRVCVRPEDGSPSDPITMRTPLMLEFEFWNLVPDTYLYLNFQLVTDQGIVAFASNPADRSGWHGHPSPIGLFHSKCLIPGDLLKGGQYYVRLLVIKDDSYVIYQHEDALVFEVQDSAELRRGWYGELVGTVRPLLQWRTELIQSNLQIAAAGNGPHDCVPEPN